MTRTAVRPAARTIGETVRFLRAEKGWTQSQLAEYAGLGTKVIHSIEKGSSQDSTNLAHVAQAFGIALSRLIEAAEQLEDAHAPMKELLALGAEMVDTAIPTLNRLKPAK